MKQLAAAGPWVQRTQSHDWKEMGLGDVSAVSDHAWGSHCLQQREKLLGEKGCWGQADRQADRQASKPPRGTGVGWLPQK